MVQAKDNWVFCLCWDLTDFVWRILLATQNNLIFLWSSVMLSAAETPACTAWLWGWVLPPSPWGPPPGPQQATDGLVNLWDEQPSEVLHYRLPGGWFALSFLINWTPLPNHILTLPTNLILICIGNLPRLGSSCGSFLNNYQTVWR